MKLWNGKERFFQYELVKQNIDIDFFLDFNDS